MVIAYAIALHLNIIFAAKEMKVNKRWFYHIIYKYLILVIFTAGGLRILEQFLWMPKSLWLHGIVYGLTFVGLYAGIARILQLEGLTIVREEVKKMDIREIVRRKLMRKN
jgi:hypothetical protein